MKILIVACVAAAACAGSTLAADGDPRQLVLLPDPMRQNMPKHTSQESCLADVSVLILRDAEGEPGRIARMRR